MFMTEISKFLLDIQHIKLEINKIYLPITNIISAEICY